MLIINVSNIASSKIISQQCYEKDSAIFQSNMT